MKRILSVILCAILLLGVAIPVYAVNAEDSTTETTAPSETVPETTAPASADETTENTTVPETTVPETTAPETSAPAHIDGCSDDCTKEDCACTCHTKSLFDRLMGAKTLDAFDTIFENASQVELDALTEQEWSQIDKREAELEPAPVPAIVLEVSEPPVAGEIIYVTVNFDNVAPIIGAGK